MFLLPFLPLPTYVLKEKGRCMARLIHSQSYQGCKGRHTHGFRVKRFSVTPVRTEPLRQTPGAVLCLITENVLPLAHRLIRLGFLLGILA